MLRMKILFIGCASAVLAAAGLYGADENLQQNSTSTQNPKLQIQSVASPASPQGGYVSVSDLMDAMASRHARMMDQMMNDAFYIPQGNISLRNSYSSYPQSKFITKDDKYIIQFAGPGIDKKDVTIKLENKSLIVSYQSSENAQKKNDDGAESYVNYTSRFAQYVTIPSDVDADKISSNYKDGILSVYLPRVESAKVQAKTIEVE